MKILKKIGLLSVMLSVVFVSFIFIGSFSIHVNAQEQVTIETNENIETDSQNYSGYGCNNGDDLQENLGEQTENSIPESLTGFGCSSTCGASREDGYSSNYHSGCRNWQVMPIIGPLYKYWIDESTLSSLSDTQKNQFINNVDRAQQNGIVNELFLGIR